VVSTLSGVVIERKVSNGQVAQPGDPLFTVADLSKVWVVGDAPEQTARSVQVGQRVDIDVPALGGRQLSGKIVYVGDTVSPDTRTVPLRTQVDNPGRELKPQMLANMRIRGEVRRALVVPQEGVATPGWWTWRALWALSEVCLLESPALAKLQQQLRPVLQLTLGQLHTRYLPAGDARFGGLALPAAIADQGADQAGLILLGLSNCYIIWPSEELRSLMLRIGDQLLPMQQGDASTPPHGAFLSWHNYWHAWGNLQSYGLLKAGALLRHTPFIEAGLREVRDFYPWYMHQGGLHQFAVEQTPEGIRLTDLKAFPQIAYDRRPMVLAALEAYRITGDTAYAHTAGRLASWLAGANPAGQAMYHSDGRTFDGIISAAQINRNAGAESTIEALLSLQALMAVPEAYQSFLDAQAALR